MLREAMRGGDHETIFASADYKAATMADLNDGVLLLSRKLAWTATLPGLGSFENESLTMSDLDMMKHEFVRLNVNTSRRVLKT
jgi:hypothetical protein